MARVKIDLPETFTFKTAIPVRIQDINFGGHLGNDAVLSILHEARVQYLQHIGCTESMAFGIALIMADASIEYKNEGFKEDTLIIELGCKDFTRVGFDIYYKVSAIRVDKNVVIAKAKTGMVYFDYKKRKMEPIPLLLKQHLNG
jgi:acyl-CoA thioester hydrolase